MKTILYNTKTGYVIGYYPDGYNVKGKPGRVDPPVLELPVIDTPPPEYNPETHRVTSMYQVDLTLKQYREVWQVHELPPPTPPTPEIPEVLSILIKKVVDGTALSEEEIQTLKTYNQVL